MVQCELSMCEGLMPGHSLTHTPYCVPLNGWELAVMIRTALNLQALALSLADFSLGCSACGPGARRPEESTELPGTELRC